MIQIKSYRFKKLIRFILDLPLAIINIFLLPTNLLIYFIYSLLFKVKEKKPRLLFGTVPIISLSYIARSLKEKGYKSEVAVVGESSIYPREIFDTVLVPKKNFGKLLNAFFGNFYAYCFFIKAVWVYDIFHYYFDGGILRHTVLNRFELSLLKIIGKSIVLLPYGSDAFVYDLIPNPIWRHGLMIEYTQFGNEAAQLQKKIRKMTVNADIVIGCLVHFINLPRWDVLPLTCYPVDTKALKPIYSNSKNKIIRIAHACNHRGVKGTVFLIDAVEELKKKGHNLELDIIEKVPNAEALKRIAACDIYVDQLIFGYAQAALEAMALGKVVISALDNIPEYDLFRRFSYLKECPIISANTETIFDVLLNLFSRQDEWHSMGIKSRDYVEKRHSFKACSELYEAIYRKVWERDDTIDLINFYHPLLEKQYEDFTSAI